jgi:hypothetical protein
MSILAILNISGNMRSRYFGSVRGGLVMCGKKGFFEMAD